MTRSLISYKKKLEQISVSEEDGLLDERFEATPLEENLDKN
jgi:hypothetical protein